MEVCMRLRSDPFCSPIPATQWPHTILRLLVQGKNFRTMQEAWHVPDNTIQPLELHVDSLL